MRKLDDNLIVYTVIEPTGATNGIYKLSALRLIDGGHCMPSFEINSSDGIQESIESWDSEDYLKRILNTLTNWKNRQLTEENLALIEELKEFIPEDDFEDVLLMFEKADKLGFFEV